MTKVLVIEDEEFIRESIIDLLEDSNYQCIPAENGKVGIDAAREFLPDIIICDIKMPELNGHEVLTELKKDPLTSSIPFVFLSAMVDKKEQRYGMNLGADDYITKPFEPSELINTIEARLKKNVDIQKRINNLRENIAFSLPHEFQTPLIAILGFSQLLLEKHANNENSDEYDFARNIYEAGNRLNHLIQNFIAFTKLELAGKEPSKYFNLSPEPELIASTLISDRVQKIAEKYNRKSDLQTEIDDASIKTSKDDLFIIVEEIADNAFKFSKAGTSVKIIGKNDDKLYHLTFSDNGRGMTEEQIANIGAYIQFERKKYEQQGSGLGLTIAKKIIEIYGGKIEILSTYGKETTINVLLN